MNNCDLIWEGLVSEPAVGSVAMVGAGRGPSIASTGPLPVSLKHRDGGSTRAPWPVWCAPPRCDGMPSRPACGSTRGTNRRRAALPGVATPPPPSGVAVPPRAPDGGTSAATGGVVGARLARFCHGRGCGSVPLATDVRDTGAHREDDSRGRRRGSAVGSQPWGRRDCHW